MTHRERHLATFERRPLDRICWQPRLEHWYNVNNRQGTLPERYREMSRLEVYDDLGCSVRAYSEFNRCLRAADDKRIKVESRETPQRIYTTWTTPAGEVSAVEYRTESAQQRCEFPIKRVEDLRVMEYMLRGREWSWNDEAYQEGLASVGERGAPTFFVPRVNLQRCFIEYIGFENTIYMLHEHPDEMERFINVINQTDDAWFEIVLGCPVRIINFGDNVHSEMLSPPLFERWVLPYQRRRADRLHAAGKFCFPHWDGYYKPLLPYVGEHHMDGYEALTPEPMGDVSLEETRAALGDLILIDGIPATDFLPTVGEEEFVARVRRILELFSPNLILGISDEISPPGDIEKVRLVSQIVESFDPPSPPTRRGGPLRPSARLSSQGEAEGSRPPNIPQAHGRPR